MTKLAVVCVGVATAMVVGAPPARADATTALDKPAFTATPQELLAAARAAPAADSGAYLVLREDQEISADDHGRITKRIRAVVLVRTPDGVHAFRTLRGPWDASYQHEPRARARVIDPGGAVVALDPKAITRTPPGKTAYGELSAELPAARAGAVIEYETVVEDRLVPIAAGRAAIAYLGAPVPTWSTRVEISAPAARKAKLFAHGLPAGAKPVHAIARGRERWSLALGMLAPNPPAELHAPADAAAAPYLGVSTAPSWSAVARDVRALVDRRIAAGPGALPAELPRTPTLETVRAIHAWVTRTVRFAGAEYSLAGIRGTPAEVVKRGDGDTREIAVLLVALLRRAGLRADVALLARDGGRDVDAELPGIDRFDHALVRVVVGGRDVWICPVSELAAPGVLPSIEQGRRALIAADTTTALVATPVAAPAQNLVRQVRTFELSERGPAKRVVEVTREGGVFEPRQRAWFRDADAAEQKRVLAAYVKDEYVAELARHSTTPPGDLATPFATTVEVTGSQRAVAGPAQLSIALFPVDALEKLPQLLLPTGGDAVAAAPRRAAFEWETPHVMEIENRIAVPPGYTLPALPADKTTPIGTATLTERHRLAGRTLVVTFRFDSGKRRLSPAELAAVQRDVAALQSQTTTILLEHTGWALAEAGKPKEAIAESERMIRLHPGEAVHHTDLASAYLQIGMGAAARRAARRAVALEPARADAHVMLGWVLQHDTLGRAYGFDHDRAAALAAYATARRLDPAHAGAALGHGGLLLRNGSGHAYAPDADLPRAAEALRAAVALAPSDETALALAAVQFRMGAFAEAERTLRARPAGEERDAWLVAAVAAGTDAPAAIQLAGSLRAGAEKQALLAHAKLQLLLARRYEAARALGAPAAFGDAEARLVRHARAPIGRDPRALAYAFLATAFDPARGERLAWDARTAAELRALVDAGGDRAAITDKGGGEFYDDFLRALYDVRATGRDAALRIEVAGKTEREQFYAAVDRGAAKLVGSSGAPAGAGRHVLRLAARNDLASAAQVLDWLVQDSAATRLSLGAVWGAGLPRHRDAIELAGALVAGSTDAARTVPIFLRCASTAPRMQSRCDHAAAVGLRQQRRWTELDAHASAMAARGAGGSRVATARVHALVGLGRFDEAERVCSDAIAAAPLDPSLPYLQIEIATWRLQFAEATRRWDAVLARAGAPASASDRNDAAWVRLFVEADLAPALALARAAAGPDRERADPSILNTVAVIEAELGELHAAKLDGWQSMLSGHRTVPSPYDWYVVGRIAEQLGLRDDALAAYRRIVPPPDGDPTSAHRLAQRRLGALGATP